MDVIEHQAVCTKQPRVKSPDIGASLRQKSINIEPQPREDLRFADPLVASRMKPRQTVSQALSAVDLEELKNAVIATRYAHPTIRKH